MPANVIYNTSAAGTALSNSVVESSLARWTIEANRLTAGKKYDFDFLGRVTAQNSTDTLLVSLRFGSSATPASNTACGSTAAVDAAVSDICVVKGTILVQSATRAVLTFQAMAPDAEGTTNTFQWSEILTIAAGTAYYLDVCGTWSVASASNSAQAESFVVVEVA